MYVCAPDIFSFEYIIYLLEKTLFPTAFQNFIPHEVLYTKNPYIVLFFFFSA